MNDKEKLDLAIKALRKIANIKTPSCEKYVQIADDIAVETLVALEA